MDNLIIFIHRAQNSKSDYLAGFLAKDFFIFNYRGKNTFSMLLKAFFASLKLPKSNIYLVEGALCLWPAFFRKLFIPKTKIIMMIPEPAFNWRNRSKLTNFILKKVFNFVDYFLPISELVAKDLKFYTSKPFSIVHHFFLLNFDELLKIQQDYSKKNILFIINRPQETGWTKGLDIVFEIFEILYQKDSEWHLYLIGAGTENYELRITNYELRNNIHLEGFQNPIKYFSFCPFILSPARYEGFNFAVVEGCTAGQIPLLSSTTGAEEFVKKIDPSLIIDYQEPEEYVDKILELYSSSQEIKIRLSKQLRDSAKIYTKENSINELKKAIIDMEIFFKTKFTPLEVSDIFD